MDISEHNVNKDPNDPPSPTIDLIASPPSYPIGLSTLIHECSSLEQQQPLSSPSNKELVSSVSPTPSPLVHCILQNMNHQGKGLDLHEQGILEPIHVKVPPHSYGLGHTPQGHQSQDVGTSSMHPKSTFHHTAYRTPKKYVAIPPPSSYKCQKHVTIYLPPSTLPPFLPTPNIP